MADRPTPEQVLWGNSTLTRSECKAAIPGFRNAGMVVGHPDDPEIIAAVMAPFANGALDAARVLVQHYLTDPEIRRAVLAALPEEPPIGIVVGMSPQTQQIIAETYRWVREDAFK